MNTNKSIISKNILKHLFFWLILTVYLCLFDPIDGKLVVQIVGMFLIIIRYQFIYYLEYFFVFPKFSEKKIILLGWLLFIFAVYFLLSYFTFVYYLGRPGAVLLKDKLLLFISNIVLFSIISVMALGTFQKKVAIQKLLKQGEREKALLFKELGFLKNQFNSHVTFNFLNYCYSKIHKNSKDTAEAIEIFSRMLRYSLSNDANDKTLLKKEIEYIEDFIKLQKLLNNDINVQFIVSGHIDKSIYILPRILIGFVENAFKHGNVNSSKLPIKIELHSSNEYLTFKVMNEKGNHQIVEVSGVGHYNLKQQMEIFYKDIYTLEIEENQSVYCSNLKLLTNH